MKCIKIHLLVYLFLAFLCSISLSAQQLNTLSEAQNSSDQFGDVNPGTNNIRIAQPFTTGSSAFTSVSVTIDFDSGSGGSVSVEIFDESGGAPGSSIGGLSGSASPGTGQETYSGNVSLAASTNYFIVLSSSSGVYNVRNTSTGNISTADGFSAPNTTYTRGTSDISWNAVGSNRFKFSLTASNPSPVILNFFEGQIIGNQNFLQWQTGTELYNSGFEIQRSPSGQNWEVMGFIEGQGTTTESNDYFWYDENPLSAANFYRLKQIDFDGQFEYSKIIVLQNGEKEEQRVFPNPARDTYLSYSPIAFGLAQEINLYNINGRLIKKEKTLNGRFDISGIPTGTYIISFISKTENFNQIIIIE